ncbi:hypothetical protein COU20_01685 [Candidatus Kaiserbacteria bacterium CG10_big_fil_rev_8_21_14_0_10_59_10]|uniref:Uncharacterized protein n=1 Tax=Candidatus Kaiserbacteria bacterium CG10_big_fil_rev_8_21_14_0_10_59_10 TaxID=1974612 RepID=A0A2H0U9X9_9BACT|nr:MAG: hypothetical protein COU20_01685 [Candidatus Kaiserbacteria bacterium CG10_big_fil_rev_8_21_14_0_10_59_10]
MKIPSVFRGAFDIFSYRHEPQVARRLGTLYWYALVALCSVAVLSFTVLGVRFLIPPESAQLVGVRGGEEVTLNRAELQATLSAFEERAAAFERLRAQGQNRADPSR